jgi:hypothetical protein
MMKHSEEFKQEAVRIALTVGCRTNGCAGFGDQQADPEQVGVALSPLGPGGSAAGRSGASRKPPVGISASGPTRT